MNWRCAAVSLLLAAPAAAAQANKVAVTLSRGPYIVDATTTSAKVCWRQPPSLDDYCQTVAGVPPGMGFKYGLPGFEGDFYGKTLPPPDQPTRFAVVGDLGEGTPEQAIVAQLIAGVEPQFVLLTGDIAYPGGTEEDYDAHYFGVYGKLLSFISFFPAVGNHDYGNAWLKFRGQRRFDEGYRKIFKRPKYYSFDAGPVHFVSIDDNEAYYVGGAEPLDDGSAQLKWLDQDLAESHAFWKIVFMHVAPFSTRRRHGDTAWLRRQLQPIFAKRRVDLVFAGHNHVYQRSARIDGTTYVTVGTGGAKLDAPGKGAPWLKKEIVAHGVVVANADLNEIKWTFYDDTGAPKDNGRVLKFLDPAQE